MIVSVNQSMLHMFHSHFRPATSVLWVAAFSGVVLLSGCVSASSFASTASKPAPGSGYVGGMFVSKPGGFITALVLSREGSKDEVILPFASERPSTERYTEVGVVAVAPGTYRVKAWMTYNALFKETEIRQDITSGPLSRPIAISASTVLFIGKLYGQTTWTPGYTSSSTRAGVSVEPIATTEAKGALAARYPSFQELAFSCLLCTN